jgi:hypothetical protein
MAAASSAQNPAATVGPQHDYGTLAVATAAAFATSVAISKGGEVISLDPTLTSTASQMALGSGIAYYHLLSRRRGGGLSPRGIVAPSRFRLRWPLASVLGALIILLGVNAAAMFGALLTGSLEFALGASTIAAITASFAIGRWIVIRADAHAVVAAMIAAAVARIVGGVSDWILAPEIIRTTLGVADLSTWLVVSAIGAILWIAAAVAGAYFGRRSREAGYLAYLLRRIPQGTRTSLLEMVYEEANELPPSSR